MSRAATQRKNRPQANARRYEPLAQRGHTPRHLKLRNQHKQWLVAPGMTHEEWKAWVIKTNQPKQPTL